MQTQSEIKSHAKLPVPTKAAVEPLVVSPKIAEVMLDSGHTRLYQLINAGDLESYCDGKSRKIVVASIHAYIARKLTDKAA